MPSVALWSVGCVTTWCKVPDGPPLKAHAADLRRLQARFPEWTYGICVGCQSPAVFFGDDEYHELCRPEAWKRVAA